MACTMQGRCQSTLHYHTAASHRGQVVPLNFPNRLALIKYPILPFITFLYETGKPLNCQNSSSHGNAKRGHRFVEPTPYMQFANKPTQSLRSHSPGANHWAVDPRRFTNQGEYVTVP